MKTRGALRFMVFESCDDFEQGLTIRFGENMPALGVLDWRGKDDPCATFKTRDEAKKAIRRTELYRLAMGDDQRPEAKFCKVVPVSIPMEPKS